MLRTLAVLLSTLLLVDSVAAGPPEAKSDHWVPVDLDQLRKDTWRNDSPNAFARVKLDMNGDGLKDEAELVTNPVLHRSALRICLASKDPKARRKCHILDEVDDETGYEVMGLLVEPPGCFEYFALNDRPDGEGKICTRAEVLDYFRVGSAASYYIHDQKTGRFNRYWYSD